MLRITLIVLLLFPAAARAYELSDNPAFCAGFLAQQSDRHAAMMRTHENAINSAFNQFGPKDSTDARGFAEWLHIGLQAAEDKTAGDYGNTLERCRALIERVIE